MGHGIVGNELTSAHATHQAIVVAVHNFVVILVHPQREPSQQEWKERKQDGIWDTKQDFRALERSKLSSPHRLEANQ